MHFDKNSMSTSKDNKFDQNVSGAPLGAICSGVEPLFSVRSPDFVDLHRCTHPEQLGIDRFEL